MRRYTHPESTQSLPIGHDNPNYDPALVGGSLEDGREQRNTQHGYLESATLRSEISMSIVTDVTRYQNGDRRPSLIRRLTQASSLTTSDDEPRTQLWCGLFNVEPVLLLLSISLGFLTTSQPLFTYWARCVEIATKIIPEKENISSVCAQLSSTNDSLQDTVEQDIATMQMWIQVASCVPSLLVAPIIGSWADKYGRRTPLLFSMVGYLLYTIFQVAAVLTYNSVSIYQWYFMAELSMGLTGGFSCIMVTALAIVTDDCRHKLRPGSSSVPVRIGVASFMQAFGRLVGNFGFSLLSVAAIVSIKGHTDSYVYSAIIQASLALFAFLYAVFFVKETHFPDRTGFTYNTTDGEIEIVQAGPERARMKDYLGSLFEVLLEKRSGWTRMCICLSLLFVFVEFLALDASLLILFVKRPPFSWTDKQFSDFSLVKGLLFSIGMVAIPLALTCVRWLGKDSIMILLGIFSSAASFFLIAQATTTTEIFLTAIFSFFAGGIAPGYRSFLPRMVPKEQTARLLTLCSMIISLCPIVSAVTFNNLFKATLHTWPGCAFFVGGVVQMVVVFGQLFIHRLMMPEWRLQKLNKRRAAEEQVVTETLENTSDEGIGSVSNTSAAGSAAPSTSDFHHHNLVT